MHRFCASALLSVQSRRGLTAAATASAKPNPVGESVQLKTSPLPNGLNVSSVDLQGATSQLVFAFRSGSRYEQHDEAGLTHQLRNAIGTDSTNYLGIRLLWVTGQSGASLEGPGTLAHVALVGQGAKLTDEKAVAVQAVLCAAIGKTGNYTDNANIAQRGVLAQHAFKASNHNTFELSRFSARCYSSRASTGSRWRVANYGFLLAYLGVMVSIVIAFAALGYSVTTSLMSINNMIAANNSMIETINSKIATIDNKIEDQKKVNGLKKTDDQKTDDPK